LNPRRILEHIVLVAPVLQFSDLKVKIGTYNKEVHLISIKDTDDFVERNFNIRGVDLRQSIIQIAGFAVYLAGCSHSA
jgi:hypothetical protein